MPTVILDHPPEFVVRTLLIDLGMATEPADDDDWPVFVSNEPDQPDSCIIVVENGSVLRGRHHFDGEVQEGYGVQIKVRSIDYSARQTIGAIVEALDQQVRNTLVEVSSADYRVYSMHRTGSVLHPGKGPGNSNRDLFTVNYVATIDQL